MMFEKVKPSELSPASSLWLDAQPAAGFLYVLLEAGQTRSLPDIHRSVQAYHADFTDLGDQVPEMEDLTALESTLTQMTEQGCLIRT